MKNNKRKVALTLVIVGILLLATGIVVNNFSKKSNLKNEEKDAGVTYGTLNKYDFITCSGELTEDNQKIPSATCLNTTAGLNTTYKMYTAIYDNSFIVDDGIIVSSYKKATFSNNLITKGDLVITLYDLNGISKWSVEYNKPYNNLNPIKSVVSAANKIDNSYYIMVTSTYSNNESYAHILKYDSNGKLVSDSVVKTGNDHNFSNLTFLANNGEDYYYINGASSLNLVVVNKDGYKIFILGDQEILPNYIDIRDNYLYGAGNFNEENETGVKLVKYDLNGNLIKEQNALTNYGYAQEGFVVTKDYIYMNYYYNEMDTYRIAKFSKNLELVNDNIDYKNDIDEEVKIYKFLRKDNKLYLVLYGESSYYIKVMDEDWNILETYKTVSEDALSMSHVLEIFDYIDGKNVQLYKSREVFDGNNEIIIAHSEK